MMKLSGIDGEIGRVTFIEVLTQCVVFVPGVESQQTGALFLRGVPFLNGSVNLIVKKDMGGVPVFAAAPVGDDKARGGVSENVSDFIA